MGDDNSQSGRLEDERQIHDTFRRYARALDDGLDDEWVDCFVPDGVWDVRVAPGATADVPTRTVRGHDALHAAAAAHTRAPAAWHKHLAEQPHVRFDDEVARCKSYFARLDVDGDGPFVRAFGRYLDTLQQCADGRWRFVQRIAVVEGSTPPAPSRLDELHAIREIEHLKARYCRLLDAQDWEAWSELFTEDAVLRGGPDADELVGREQIVEWVRHVLTDAVTVHQAKLPEIHITGPDSATGIWAMFDDTDSPLGFTDRICRDAPDRRHSTMRSRKQGWGHYHEEYRREPSAGWRIAALTLSRLRIDRH